MILPIQTGEMHDQDQYDISHVFIFIKVCLSSMPAILQLPVNVT